MINADRKPPFIHSQRGDGSAAITLFNAGHTPKAKDTFSKFQGRFDAWSEEMKNADPDINEHATALMSLLRLAQ